MATIQHAGWVFKDDGTAVNGATVQLYEQGSTSSLVTLAEGGTSVTTNSSGYWSATTTSEPDSTGSYYGHDVKITSGSSVRYRRGLDRMQVAEVDIRNATGATQGGLLVANNANTASNKVATFANRRKTGADGDEIYLSFEMMNDADEIHEFARITAEVVDASNGNEDGQIRFGIADGDKSGDAGGIVDVLTLNTTTGGVTSVITDTASQYNNTITVGVDDTGYDVKFFGATASAYMLWDESEDDLILGGAARLVVPDGQLVLGSTAVSSTPAELNLMDGGSSIGTTTVSDGHGIVMNHGGTMAQTTVQTLAAYLDDEITAMPNLVTVGTIGTGTWNADVIAAAKLPDASTSAQGVVELAIASEVTTGTSTGLAVTPDALAGSVVFGTRYVQCVVFDFATDIVEGNGKFYFHIPAGLNGMNLVEVHSEVITAGNGSTVDVQIHNVTHTADMLSTSLTINSTKHGSDEAGTTAAVINTSEDDVATNDLIRIDVDGNGGDTTIAKGLIVTLGFRLP